MSDSDTSGAYLDICEHYDLESITPTMRHLSAMYENGSYTEYLKEITDACYYDMLTKMRKGYSRKNSANSVGSPITILDNASNLKEKANDESNLWGNFKNAEE